MKRATCFVLLIGLHPSWGCRVREPAAREESTSRVEVSAETAAPAGLTAVNPGPPTLQMVNAEPGYLRMGPGAQPFDVALRTQESSGGHNRQIGTKAFQVSLRSAELTSAPCVSCHMGASIIERERVADAHQNVQPVHPAETGAACGTCHDAGNVERLRLESGETASLDQAYRVCAQCHFVQVESWAGGAHGKRLDGWRGRRVLMGCADCHDPHRPAVEKRIPFPGPRLPSLPSHRE